MKSLFLNKKWLLVASYLVYLAILSYTMLHHELWGDELHSWNIAKASNSFTDLIANSRYEGHPPLWYIVMWVLSKFTHNLLYLQCVQLSIIAAAVYLAMFRSSLPIAIKTLLPFGYYFIFECGVLSRNYAIGVLLAFAICILLSRNARARLPLYYLLIFLLSNTHLLGFLLACSLHLYFLLQQREQKLPTRSLWIYTIAGVLVLLPSVYFIMPPGDSSLGWSFWMGMWDISHHLGVIAAVPVRAMLPMPAYWDYHFWNTNFLLEQDAVLRLHGVLLLFVSLLLILVISYVFRHNKKCLYLFVFNLVLTALVSLIAPLTNARYVGFIYISFVVAAWMLYSEGKVPTGRARIILLFILAQIPGGLFAVAKDIRYPFSEAENVQQLINEIPVGEKMVTDYWCLNNIVAYTDKPAYCIDLNRELTFLQWNKQLRDAMVSKKHYTNGAALLFKESRLPGIYMISINSWQQLLQKDTAFTKTYHVEMIDSREGAIEKSSNLYLYHVSPR